MEEVEILFRSVLQELHGFVEQFDIIEYSRLRTYFDELQRWAHILKHTNAQICESPLLLASHSV